VKWEEGVGESWNAGGVVFFCLSRPFWWLAAPAQIPKFGQQRPASSVGKPKDRTKRVAPVMVRAMDQDDRRGIGPTVKVDKADKKVKNISKWELQATTIFQ